MFKFLRKYDKWILAIGGSLLLITFLVPQAIQGLSEYSAQTGASWATVGKSGQKITQGEADMLRSCRLKTPHCRRRCHRCRDRHYLGRRRRKERLSRRCLGTARQSGSQCCRIGK